MRDVSHGCRAGPYLPAAFANSERSRVSPEEILNGVWSERFLQAAESVAGQARKFYNLARETLPVTDRRSMAAAELMGSVYWRLLRKLERQRFQVFGQNPTRLSKGQKTLLIFRTWCRIVLGLAMPNYGLP